MNACPFGVRAVTFDLAGAPLGGVCHYIRKKEIFYGREDIFKVV